MANFIAPYLLFALASGGIAKERGYSFWRWFAIGLALPFMGAALACGLPEGE